MYRHLPAAWKDALVEATESLEARNSTSRTPSDPEVHEGHDKEGDAERERFSARPSPSREQPDEADDHQQEAPGRCGHQPSVAVLTIKDNVIELRRPSPAHSQMMHQPGPLSCVLAMQEQLALPKGVSPEMFP